MVKLSPTEREILEALWKTEGMTNSEVILYFRERGKDWKKQTTSTFLTRMIQKGVVKKEGHKYMAACTEEGLGGMQARMILNKMYGGSLKNFIVSLREGEKIPAQEIEEIKDILEAYRSSY